MQKLDPRKRVTIASAAARLFARAPYHEVTLDQVASAARVGKGTLYLYFKDKDHLYASLLSDGLGALAARLRAHWQKERAPWELIEAAVRELVAFAAANPAMFEVLRAGACGKDARLDRAREDLRALLLEAVRAGGASGELDAARPELTAAVIPSLVRGALLFGPKLPPDEIAAHLLGVLGNGIRRAKPRPRARSGGAR